MFHTGREGNDCLSPKDAGCFEVCLQFGQGPTDYVLVFNIKLEEMGGGSGERENEVQDNIGNYSKAD